MSVVLTKPTIEVEQRTVLHGISRHTYELLLKDHEDRSVPRFTYDGGNLEIYMPSEKHEKVGHSFEFIVSTLVEEMELDMLSFGSTTFTAEETSNSVEPDCCFYIQHVEDIRDAEKLDLATHPPPDLVVEVDITSPSISRFPIYAQLGVPEIWRYFRENVKIYVLADARYVEIESSLALPYVTNETLTSFLLARQTEKHIAWIRNMRTWARENCLPQET